MSAAVVSAFQTFKIQIPFLDPLPAAQFSSPSLILSAASLKSLTVCRPDARRLSVHFKFRPYCKVGAEKNHRLDGWLQFKTAASDYTHDLRLDLLHDAEPDCNNT